MDATNSSAHDTTANTAGYCAQDAATTTAYAWSYDEPYRFGRRPTSRAPFPFTEREFARLLVVRSRLQARDAANGAVEA